MKCVCWYWSCMRHTWQVLFVWHIQISFVPYHISDKQIGYVLTPCASKMVTTRARDRDIFPGAHNMIVSASITCIACSVRMKARLWGGASHLGSSGAKTLLSRVKLLDMQASASTANGMVIMDSHSAMVYTACVCCVHFHLSCECKAAFRCNWHFQHEFSTGWFAVWRNRDIRPTLYQFL